MNLSTFRQFHSLSTIISISILLSNCTRHKFTVQATVPPNCIIWTSDTCIHWLDFQRRPPWISNHDAASSCSFSGAHKIVGNSVLIVLVTYFIRDSAWVRPGQANSKLLNHERRHFDLFEIAARKARKELFEMNGAKREYFEYLPLRHFFDSTSWASSVTKEYDSATNHGLNNYEQSKWNKQIDSLLESYDEFKDRYIQISIGTDN